VAKKDTIRLQVNQKVKVVNKNSPLPRKPLFASNSKLSFPYGVMQVKQQRIVANKNKGVCLTLAALSTSLQ
jgi:hypothetical protein